MTILFQFFGWSPFHRTRKSHWRNESSVITRLVDN